jgi:hypothetical protein
MVTHDLLSGRSAVRLARTVRVGEGPERFPKQTSALFFPDYHKLHKVFKVLPYSLERWCALETPPKCGLTPANHTQKGQGIRRGLQEASEII